MSYQYFALIQPDSDADISKLKENLDAFYANKSKQPSISLEDNSILVDFEDFDFEIYYAEDEHVIDESIEMSEDFEVDFNEMAIDKEKVKLCAKRFEISGSDDDFDMNFMNDSLFILEQIEKFKGVTILNLN